MMSAESDAARGGSDHDTCIISKLVYVVQGIYNGAHIRYSEWRKSAELHVHYV